MKAVVDTNVIVSGLINPFGAPGKIVQLISAKDLLLYYDARVLSEYRSVLARPEFEFYPHEVNVLLDQIEASGALVASRPIAQRLVDRSDEVFLEVAVAAHSKYLVTGNLRHFPAKSSQSVKIVLPNEFLETYRKESR